MTRVVDSRSPLGRLSACLAFLAMLLLVGSSSAPAAEITVDALANIYGAGHALAPEPGGGGAGQLPPVITFTAGLNTFTFNVFGEVTPSVGNVPYNGPEGGGDDGHTNVTAFGGLSGIQHSSRSQFLVGVFLTDDEPTDPAPGTLSYNDGENFDTASPQIAQVFFIGDGKKDSDGNTQFFVAPTNATRLFLGFADAVAHDGAPGAYGDNAGYFCVKYEITPEPSTMVLGGMAAVGAVLMARRRRTAKA